MKILVRDSTISVRPVQKWFAIALYRSIPSNGPPTILPPCLPSSHTQLGGKGANLAEMCSIGLNVPPGLTITTESCAQYTSNGGKFPEGLWEEVLLGLQVVESEMGCKLGDPNNPLLLSVRSGAAISMPGMMDTILNLGLNDDSVKTIAARSGDRFALDAYRRFLDMFGDVVLGINHALFEAEIQAVKETKGVKHDVELVSAELKEVVERYKEVYKRAGMKFPQDPYHQLKEATKAVFNSWQSPRARKYRSLQGIRGLAGTAVNIQAMVFGNYDDKSSSGVCFTRNPSTGEATFYGEYLPNAQGEDVVAGIRSPLPILELKKMQPEAYTHLVHNCQLLEQHYKDMQDIEFTVQSGQLYMLQCRSGKRTGQAAVKIAVDMVDEQLIDIPRAIMAVEARHLDQLLHPQFEDEKANSYQSAVRGRGLPASPGAAVGQVVFTAARAEDFKVAGKPCILVRTETSPEDVGGLHVAEGVLTARGGMTSHAAVVARGWGKPCVAGCDELWVDEANHTAKLNEHHALLKEGDWISINGTTGEVLVGKQPLTAARLTGDLGRFMEWVDQHRRLRVLTNADTPKDALAARRNGAEGIGLVRTEHMFFASEDRIAAVRRMIVAQDTKARKEALQLILPFQRSDFEGIFKAMDGLPVTIRLLDPPLHEFLPEGDVVQISNALAATSPGVSPADIAATIEHLVEVNPMLGFRGCRLGITYPEITEMQVRAIFEAALNVVAEHNNNNNKDNTIVPHPDIMIPLVGTPEELINQVSLVRKVANDVMEEHDGGERVEYGVGTMIEVPRAALVADKIAQHADFFSFGTNDLTQMTFGYSRDDAGKFLPQYLSQGILEADPFEILDQQGVGQLIKMATERGRSTKPGLKVGICGEHGGEPSSVKFCHNVGLDYVSCSPFRVPIARLAAAQAAVEEKKMMGGVKEQ